jgi:hypothetical protein
MSQGYARGSDTVPTKEVSMFSRNSLASVILLTVLTSFLTGCVSSSEYTSTVATSSNQDIKDEDLAQGTEFRCLERLGDLVDEISESDARVNEAGAILVEDSSTTNIRSFEFRLRTEGEVLKNLAAELQAPSSNCGDKSIDAAVTALAAAIYMEGRYKQQIENLEEAVSDGSLDRLERANLTKIEAMLELQSALVELASR